MSSTPTATRSSPRALGPLALALFLVLGPPVLALALQPGTWLAHPDSELPVRFWAFETFSGSGLLGGMVDGVGHPYPGPLNNPDPLGSLFWTIVAPVVGPSGAYNLLALATLAANTAAAWLLARDHVRDGLAAASAAVVLGSAPIMLSYALASAIADVLHLWPWLLAMLFGLRALRRPGWRDGLLAGAMMGLGCIASIHNLLVISVLVIPLVLGLPLAWRERLVPVEDPRASGVDARQWLRAVGAAGLAMAPLAGGWLWVVRSTMSAPDGQMSVDTVQSARHAPPFPNLHADVGGYVFGLVDYLRPGAGGLIVRDLISHQLVAATPGLVALGLAVVAVVLAKGRRRSLLMWLGAAFFAALASAGPFLAITRSMELPAALNPAWLSAYWLLPGGRLVLEPFRYAIPVVLALVVPVAFGASALIGRWGRWVGWSLPLVVLVEGLLISPMPFPLPVASLDTPAAYARLDELLPPGAIVELPLWDGASSRFERRHFSHQLVHGRPIMDDVAGFVPRYLPSNELVATAALMEGFRPGVEIGRRGHPRSGVPLLAQDGFAGVVVDPAGYETPEQAAEVVELLSGLLGPAVELGDRLVFEVPEPAEE